MSWEMPSQQGRSSPGRAEAQECANCKMTIERDAVEKGGQMFCCDGCAYGGPCIC